MRIQFLGAVRTVTGSMHLIEANGRRILLDAGLYQGRRKEAFERNRQIPVDPASLHAIVLSHAHIDHSGNLPSFIRGGFKGAIHATDATADLCDPMLRDSAMLQKRDVEFVNMLRRREGKTPFEPLYTEDDVDRTLEFLRGVPYEKEIEVSPGIRATFHDAGHILGSALVDLRIDEDGTSRRLIFTGDLGRPGMPILRDPWPLEGADVLISESTYGDRLHDPPSNLKKALLEILRDAASHRSKVLIPAFSIGRTQNIVYYLHEMWRDGVLPEMPIFVDSPLSVAATRVVKAHPECFDEETRAAHDRGDDPFSFGALRYVEGMRESESVAEREGPALIIAASGMCEGGRIVYHLAASIEKPRTTVLIVGFQAENTLGRKLVDGETRVRILGGSYRVRARIKVLNGLSAHPDRDELLAYFRPAAAEIGRTFIVHGEEEQSLAFAEHLTGAGYADVVVPEPGQAVEV
ncbi:MAG: MBL fold metallo-hydrolase [Planctomycetes bacterium]|nr:MBL fold metallo-hydrolase [Planctomycetota bacterium]